MAPYAQGRDEAIETAKTLPTTSDSDSLSSASFQNIQDPTATNRSEGAWGNQSSTSASTSSEDVGDITMHDPSRSPDASSGVARDPTGAAPPSQQQPAGSTHPEDQRTKLQTSLIVAALCSAVFLAALDVTITTVAIPTISADFNSSAGYTWIGSAYLLANAAAAPSWGKISDIFGRKPILLAAVAVFWVGSLICATSVNMAMLIVGRAVQGIGGGGTLILVNICISDMFSVRKRGVYLGFVGMVWAVAGGFGPVLGGALTTLVTWRWCFYINLPISGLALAILYFTVKLHNPKTPVKQGLAAVDWLGSLTIVGGTLMFLLGLELGGGTYPWSSPTVICLIIFGLFVASLCVLVEVYVAKYPIIPIQIFSNRRNMAILGLCACHGFVFISVSYYMPLYFQGVLGASALMSGVYVLPFTFVLGATSAAAGFAIKKTGKYLPPIIGGFTLMTIGYGLFIDLDPYANWPKIILFQIVLGLGVGPNFQSPLIALQSTVQPREIASATSTFMFVRQLSTSISIVVGGVIFDNGMQRQLSRLVDELGHSTAELLAGQNAASSVTAVAKLPEPQRGIAQDAYWNALRTMFIFYVAFAGLGLLISCFVGGKTLSKEHTEFKTGLHTLEPAKKAAMDEEKRASGEEGAPSGVVKEATPAGQSSAARPGGTEMKEER